MKPFSLIDEPIAVVNVNFRLETHGEDHITACDIRCEMRRENTALAIIDPALIDMLYVDGFPDHAKITKSLAGMDRKAHLRVPTLAKPLEISKELTGVMVRIPWGLNDEITLPAAKVNKWRVEALEGGSVVISFRVQSTIDPGDASKIVSIWLGGEVQISMDSAQSELELEGEDA